jgi:multiple sugar transport system permease protein
MNWMHWLLISLTLLFAVLMLISQRLAWGYARISVLTLAGSIILVPFFWLICSAIKDPDALNKYVFLPPPRELVPDIAEKKFDLVNGKNFRELFSAQETVQGPVVFWRYILNSIFLATTQTFVALVFCSMGGYALAKYRFPGRHAILTFMLASLTIPGVVLLAPNFDLIWRLGWMDTYLALIVPGCVGAFGIFLFRQALMSVPDDLIEAGRIDGCNEFRIYLQLAMPLVRPMTGAFCLISFLGAWNSFLTPSIFLQSQSKLPLPVVLNQYVGQYAQQYGVYLAGTLIAIIPPALLFLALQREFISGLTSGAVKQ